VGYTVDETTTTKMTMRTCRGGLPLQPRPVAVPVVAPTAAAPAPTTVASSGPICQKVRQKKRELVPFNLRYKCASMLRYLHIPKQKYIIITLNTSLISCHPFMIASVSYHLTS
jgi:hypothetical protein